MATAKFLTDEEREKLVAYLDGELDAKTAHLLESKIGRNPLYRTEIESLRRAWEMLDFLPQAEASAAFSSRTLQSVSVLRPEPRKRWWRDPTLRRWILGLAWAAAVLVAFATGFAGVERIVKRDQVHGPELADRGQISAQDHRVIENSRLYDNVDEAVWISRLPQPTRDELAKLTGDELRRRIAGLRQQESDFQDSWQHAMRHWDEITRPAPQLRPLPQLMPEIKSFITYHLMPVLSAEEKNRLQASLGHDSQFLGRLVELSDKHLLWLPGPPIGPKYLNELPTKVQDQLKEYKNRPLVRRDEGKWPEFCIAVTNFLNTRAKIAPQQQLGPCRPSEFTPDIRQFIDKKLLSVLEPDEKMRLTNAEGRWPMYPRQLAEMAFRHGLRVPGTALPGPPEYWESFRKRNAKTQSSASLDTQDNGYNGSANRTRRKERRRLSENCKSQLRPGALFAIFNLQILLVIRSHSVPPMDHRRH